MRYIVTVKRRIGYNLESLVNTIHAIAEEFGSEEDCILLKRELHAVPRKYWETHKEYELNISDGKLLQICLALIQYRDLATVRTEDVIDTPLNAIECNMSPPKIWDNPTFDVLRDNRISGTKMFVINGQNKRRNYESAFLGEEV